MSTIILPDKLEGAPQEAAPEEENAEEKEDNASVLVIILQCETKSCDSNISRLKWGFSDPYFIVQVCSVDIPKSVTNIQQVENYRMKKVLNYAAEGPYVPNVQGDLEPQSWWCEAPVIVVKDSSIINIAPSNIGEPRGSNISKGPKGEWMKHRIKTALDKANKADLFFLCKWNDACNKYSDVEGVDSTNYSGTLKWSTQPTATQAIMYTPSSRDYTRKMLASGNAALGDMLNANISQRKLLATVFVPNIIDFDINLATSNEDYNKLNECAPAQTSSTTSNNNLTWLLWISVIVVTILLIAFIFFQFGLS